MRGTGSKTYRLPFFSITLSTASSASVSLRWRFLSGTSRRSAPLSVAVDEGIATVTIDNPPINLFTVQAFVEMAGLVGRLAADDNGARASEWDDGPATPSQLSARTP